MDPVESKIFIQHGIDVTIITFHDEKILEDNEFKKNIAVPYFKDIYKDLVGQSGDKTKGIN